MSDLRKAAEQAQPEQAPSSVQQAYAMAQVCLDLHDALGCKWGDNVYLAIDQLKAAAHTPQRKPLTEEEIEDLYFDKFSMGELKAFARAIEAAHGIKGKRMTLGQYLWDQNFWWLCVGFLWLVITVVLIWRNT